MADTDYSHEKFIKDAYGNLIPLQTKKKTKELPNVTMCPPLLQKTK